MWRASLSGLFLRLSVLLWNIPKLTRLVSAKATISLGRSKKVPRERPLSGAPPALFWASLAVLRKKRIANCLAKSCTERNWSTFLLFGWFRVSYGVLWRKFTARIFPWRAAGLKNGDWKIPSRAHLPRKTRHGTCRY